MEVSVLLTSSSHRYMSSLMPAISPISLSPRGLFRFSLFKWEVDGALFAAHHVTGLSVFCCTAVQSTFGAL